MFADRCKVNYISREQASPTIFTPADIRRNIETWAHVFPDIRVEINNLINDTSHISVFCSLKGHHLGEYNNILPTGNPLIIDTLCMYKVAQGKICEQWIGVELQDVLQPAKLHKNTSLVAGYY